MLHHHASRLFNRPLLCTDFYAKLLTTVLAGRFGVQPQLAQGEIPATRPASDPMLLESGVFVLPIVGGLVHRGDGMDAASGLQSYTNVSNRIAAALRNDKVKAILLDIDSPGGEVGGLFGFADALLGARKVKPIWGIANERACSAAYALLASCSKAYATASAQVGSIGVVWQHVDVSKMLTESGIVTTLIYAGEHKVDGNPYEPLSKADVALFQGEVDQVYSMFVATVAKRRPLDEKAIRDTEARVYGGEDAKRLKLIDGVLPFQAVLARLEASLASPSVSQPLETIVEHDSTVTTEEEPAMKTYTQDQLDAAVAAARTEAHAAGVAEGQKAGTVEGYAAGRTDAGAIFTDAAAAGKGKLAATLAADAAIDKTRAVAILAASAAEQQAPPSPQLPGAMPGNNPTVGAGAGDQPTQAEAEAKKRAELTEMTKRISGQTARHL